MRIAAAGKSDFQMPRRFGTPPFLILDTTAILAERRDHDQIVSRHDDIFTEEHSVST
jgi:hypothetical protein